MKTELPANKPGPTHMQIHLSPAVPMRILITGSRDWLNFVTVHKALDAILFDLNHPPVLVHGAASGVDTVAAGYWASFGYPVEPHPADWNRFGRKRAGVIRNAQMVQAGADKCIAFIRNHSRGATHCSQLAIKSGIPTIIYRED